MLKTYWGLGSRIKNAAVNTVKGGAFASYADNQFASVVMEGTKDRGNVNDTIYGNKLLFMCGVSKCGGDNVCGE